jgi:hypothetical protein
MKPVYELAVMNVRVKYSHAQDARLISGDARFRTTLRDVLWTNYSMAPREDMALCVEFEHAWQTEWKPRFIPDLWWIDATSQTIHLYEIEDTHPLSQDKLCLLHDWWWDMDAINWMVTLTVFDRYGLNARSLDLTQFAFHMITTLSRDDTNA